ncbi:hypothetical protein JX265_003358 [Neoarthrinium moseri]|uniref:UBZ4-type domain-containing protein n=1 Tax=Neoarthrinium moseri TaxID=1658444 RepID=A0A9P9WRR0_9PEZI|nr:hypothetical protein JX266_004364 [Neoarthrinium moseri]KAI1877350.1 hypothetical protein JX265_003358 [Neoarthrinium moseri]
MVPNIRQVIPGAAVSIVLKADQPTGREVQGIVKDVLTRGDHHRGIKVRLADGRIGRVQRMDSGAAGSREGTSGASAPGAGDSTQPPPAFDALPPPRHSGRRPRYRDIRSDEPLEAPQEQIDLSAYIVAPKRKGKGRKSRPLDDDVPDDQPSAPATGSGGIADVSSATATCPVCGTFEGDEAAVAHHVAEHFE